MSQIGPDHLNPAHLSPAQRHAYERLGRGVEQSPLILFRGSGRGATTVLTAFARSRGGHLLRGLDLVQTGLQYDPLAIEDAFFVTVERALRAHELVLVDDFGRLARVLDQCHFYPRGGLIGLHMKTLVGLVEDLGRRLVIAEGSHHASCGESMVCEIPEFEPADYAFFGQSLLPAERAARLDFAKIHRFAPSLDIHRLRHALRWFGKTAPADADTAAFMVHLREHYLSSNVALTEVAEVRLEDLVGVDDVVESLLANIVVPLENDELAARLSLRPKRGVLLVGPPGTGKTTVGRALARRLQGKFFVIDGTVISGTENFYHHVNQIFEEAMENAPAVVFIDDSDVIFESGEEHGLYRYLLTMLDGLESKSANRVCVILTAMNVANLPPALIRSGRVELWLEMRLPDAQARQELLRREAARLPEELRGTDVVVLAQASDGLSAADLKRAVQDSKILLANDLAHQRPTRSGTEYLRQALQGVQENQRRYFELMRAANARRARRPPWFEVGMPPEP
jgi:transitional endoplasmic reticulum ATPase